MTQSLRPSAGWIDPRGHRFGAAVSATLLGIAAGTSTPWVVAGDLVVIGASAVFGMRYSVFGLAWRRIVRVLGLSRVELEHPYPPRFAQVIGSVVLLGSTIAFLLGYPAVAWVLALAVATLQVILALTGFCFGCRLFFVRWWLPAQVARWWQHGVAPEAMVVPSQINFK